MASDYYEYYPLNHRVSQYYNTLDRYYEPANQIVLNIKYRLLFIRHDNTIDRFIDSNTHPYQSRSSYVTLRFNFKDLKNRNSFYQLRLAPALDTLRIVPMDPNSDNFEVLDELLLASAFDKLRIEPRSLDFNDFIKQINSESIDLIGCTSEVNLLAAITSTVIIHIGNRQDPMERALSQSALEYEANDYGMVPAKRSSIKKMLTKVIVELKDEDCLICLQELEVGFDASQMPCSHTFHYNCIKKWLNKSHCCPICRFELPKRTG